MSIQEEADKLIEKFAEKAGSIWEYYEIECAILHCELMLDHIKDTQYELSRHAYNDIDHYTALINELKSR